MLEERDVLLSILADIRGEGPSSIAGLRELLGHSGAVSRAAQQPEARLAETERVLELVLRASSTGVVISNPETAHVYEANDAFCRFYGRSRAEIVGHRSVEDDGWYDVAERARLLEEVRQKGMAERVLMRLRQPDGSVRLGETTAHFVALAGTRQLLSTVDDVTEQHRLDAERRASIKASRAITQLGARLLGGRSLADCLAALLPELRSSGEFRCALLWDLARGQPTLLDGEEPPLELERAIDRGRPVGEDGVLFLGSRAPSRRELSGWAVPLHGTGSLLVLVRLEAPLPSEQELFAGVLADVAMLASAVSAAAVEQLGV
jgi:PAS domain S-box-containing protein